MRPADMTRSRAKLAWCPCSLCQVVAPVAADFYPTVDARRCLNAMKPADMELGLQCHADVLVDIDSCRLIRPELQTGPLSSTMFVCHSDLSSRECVCRMLFLKRQSRAKSAMFARRGLHV